MIKEIEKIAIERIEQVLYCEKHHYKEYVAE